MSWGRYDGTTVEEWQIPDLVGCCTPLQEHPVQVSVTKNMLSYCILCRLWENSKHVAKQLDKIGKHLLAVYTNYMHGCFIGPTLSNALANAGMISFEKIASTNPRELELVKIYLLLLAVDVCFRLSTDIHHLVTK